MKLTFDIVHKRPDKSEQVVASVQDRTDIERYTEVPRYVGTWLTKDEKLLRYGLGSLLVKEVMHPATAIYTNSSVENGQPVHWMKVSNHDKVGWIRLSIESISVYALSKSVKLFEVNSFAELADRLEKEVAFEVMECYESKFSTSGVL